MSSEKTLRWGILAAGGIAHKFADALNSLDCARLTAIGSRSLEKARDFGSLHGIDSAHCFGSYEELCASPDVDVIYVASPHSHHAQHSHLAINGGKHVFAEKSFTLTPAEAEGVFAAAKAKGLFSGEAMWTRFLPANIELMKVLNSGELGQLHTAAATFCSHFPDDLPPTHRVLDTALGGGALMDMGVYPASWLSMIAGDAEPQSVSAAGALYAPTGCDERATILCKYENGPETSAFCAIKTSLPSFGWVSGEKGHIIAPDFWNAYGFSVKLDSGKSYEFSGERNPQGFVYEIESVTADILEGRVESSVGPHSSTMCVQRILEKARHAIGFRYDIEK